MASRTLKERTIAFFEVVEMRDGEQLRLPQLPWPEALGAVAYADVDDRTVEEAERYVGNIATVEDHDHLLLHRVKNAGEWLSIMNWSTGEWRELESKAHEGYLDTSVMCFLDFGNVVGIMQGSTSSPSHKALEAWLNGLKLMDTASLVVRPLMSQAEIRKLRAADGARRMEIRIGSDKMPALQERNGRLARFLRKANQEYGDINVTVIISVPRGRTRQEDRASLLDDLRDLEAVLPHVAEKAKAQLVYSDAEGVEYTQLAEFIEHHITAKRRVPAVDEEGRSIRILSAVGAIMGEAAEHEAELRRAAGVPEAGPGA